MLWSSMRLLHALVEVAKATQCGEGCEVVLPCLTVKEAQPLQDHHATALLPSWMQKKVQGRAGATRKSRKQPARMRKMLKKSRMADARAREKRQRLLVWCPAPEQAGVEALFDLNAQDTMVHGTRKTTAKRLLLAPPPAIEPDPEPTPLRSHVVCEAVPPALLNNLTELAAGFLRERVVDNPEGATIPKPITQCEVEIEVEVDIEPDIDVEVEATRSLHRRPTSRHRRGKARLLAGKRNVGEAAGHIADMMRWERRRPGDGGIQEYWFRPEGSEDHVHWFTVCQGDGMRGKYVVAARDFRSGEAVVAYHGEIITEEEKKQRESAGVGDHIMQIGSTLVDGVHSEGGGQFLNSALPKGKCVNNVQQSGAPYGTLRTRRPVMAGQELLLEYGKEYWKSAERQVLLETLYKESI